jgi:hypothetical protein
MEKLFHRNANGKSGESRKDFIHKIKVVLKELRETSVSVKKNLCRKFVYLLLKIIKWIKKE